MYSRVEEKGNDFKDSPSNVFNHLIDQFSSYSTKFEALWNFNTKIRKENTSRLTRGSHSLYGAHYNEIITTLKLFNLQLSKTSS